MRLPIQTLIIPQWLLLRKMIISQLELGPPVTREPDVEVLQENVKGSFGKKSGSKNKNLMNQEKRSSTFPSMSNQQWAQSSAIQALFCIC